MLNQSKDVHKSSICCFRDGIYEFIYPKTKISYNSFMIDFLKIKLDYNEICTFKNNRY